MGNQNAIVRYWPVLSVLVAIGTTFGVAQSQIIDARASIELMKSDRQRDHDEISELKSDIKVIKSILERMEKRIEQKGV